MTIQNEPWRHHYLPVFYLKQWALDAEGELCQFSKPRDTVVARMKPPTGTGFKPYLYTVKGIEPEESQSIETVFMRAVDQLAADALHLLFNGTERDFTVDIKSGWSRFLMSLIQRNPEKVAWISDQIDNFYKRRMKQIEENYQSYRLPDYPETFVDFAARLDPAAQEKSKAILLQSIIDLESVGKHINSMIWSVVTLNYQPYPFFTSDRPIVMTNGLGYPTSFILLPLGPSDLFVAVNNVTMENQLRASLNDGALFDYVNDMVVSQAQKYVYGVDKSMLEYVDKRLGTRRKMPAQPSEHTLEPLFSLADIRPVLP